MDGSAASFVFMLQQAGLEEQGAPKKFIRVKKPVEIREGQGAAEKWARLEPYHGFKLDFLLSSTTRLLMELLKEPRWISARYLMCATWHGHELSALCKMLRLCATWGWCAAVR